MSEWQLIDTAERNQKPILAFGRWAGEINGPSDEDTICVIQWTGGNTDYPGYQWRVYDSDAYAEWFRPTHWMPLPESPV